MVVVLAIIVAITGWALLILYAAFNAAGTVLYLDGLDPRQARTRRLSQVFGSLTALLVPVGFYGLLASKGSGTPTDDLVGDEGLRNQAGGASNMFARRSGR